MTVEARVAAFITSKKPAPWCDDCIAKTLRLGSGANRAMARNATSGLGHNGLFTRREGTCTNCRRTKLVIRA